MSELKFIFEFTGAIVVTILLIAIPILATCSFFYGWIATIKYLLVLLTISEWLVLLAYYVNER